MSKVNKATAAKVARQNKQYYDGVVRDSRYYSHYSQGMDAWTNEEVYSNTWHPHKQQGWRKARNNDIAFATQCPTARARVERRLGLLKAA